MRDVKKFDNTGEETDDLISIGTVGLIKAIGTFKPDKGTRLATYAARCIENETSVSNPAQTEEESVGNHQRCLCRCRRAAA